MRSDDLLNELSKVDVFDEFKQKMWEFYRSGLNDECTLKHGTNEFKVNITVLSNFISLFIGLKNVIGFTVEIF